MFISLLFVKIFHWLCSDRVEYVETSPNVSRLSHLRVVTLMLVLLSLDVGFLQYAIAHTLKAGPSVLLLFGFEYVILASR
jgi:E3 ubiquitin-protein ligase synoviolin